MMPVVISGGQASLWQARQSLVAIEHSLLAPTRAAVPQPGLHRRGSLGSACRSQLA